MRTEMNATQQKDVGGGDVGGVGDGNNQMLNQNGDHLPLEALRWMVYQMNGSDGTCWVEECDDDAVAVDGSH